MLGFVQALDGKKAKRVKGEQDAKTLWHGRVVCAVGRCHRSHKPPFPLANGIRLCVCCYTKATISLPFPAALLGFTRFLYPLDLRRPRPHTMTHRTNTSTSSTRRSATSTVQGAYVLSFSLSHNQHPSATVGRRFPCFRSPFPHLQTIFQQRGKRPNLPPPYQ